MPGNEVGDRVHNFFDQGSLSQDQRHTQLVAGNWPGYSNHNNNNNIWSANERQTSGPVNSGSENYSAHQSEIERGQGNQFSLSSHGLHFTRSSLRPEFVKSPSQLQQLNLNGFMHASQVGHARQNEANFLGVDPEPDQHHMTPQQRSGSQHSNSASFGGSEPPMNFNFLGGQHETNGQQPGMLQSLPRQQPGNIDSLMQQQIILKKMQELQRRELQRQELQRQEQLQQIEGMQRSPTGHMTSFPNQIAGQHPTPINGNGMRDTSNYPWSSQVMIGKTNWQQHGLSSSGQGYSNGFMITPEQGQSMQLMGLIPQQTSHSFYGVPVSSSQSANAFSHGNIDKTGMHQAPAPAPAPNSSFPGNQYGLLAEQGRMKDGPMVSRYGNEGKSSFDPASSQRLGNMLNSDGFTQLQQRNVPMSEGGGQGFAGHSDLLAEKSVTQASSQSASTQSAVGLDPTEEKILFGNDVNIWEAFGGSPITGSGDATEILNGFPSVQSGTWSALMQSAVAETTSTDVGMQEEWSGLGSQSSRLQSGYQHPTVFHGQEKSQPGSRLGNNDVITHNSNTNNNYANSSGQHLPFLNQKREYSQTESQIAQEERRWLDNNQQQKPNLEKQVVGNSYSSRDCSRTENAFWSHQHNTFLHDNNAQQSSRPSHSNFVGSLPANGGIASTIQDNLLDKDRNLQMSMDTGHGAAMRLEPVSNSSVEMRSSHFTSKDHVVAPGLNNMKVNLESNHRLPNNHQLDLWNSVNSSGKSELDGSGRDQHILNKGPPIFESSDNNTDDVAAELHETENGDTRESSNDSHHSNLLHNAPVGRLRENMWSDTSDRRSLPGGKEKSSSQAGKRVPLSRKFQYHPMGDVDMDSDSSFAAKQVLHSQPISQQLSSGIKGQDTNPRFLTSISDMEKGGVPNFHGSVNVSRRVSSSVVHPGYLPNTTAPFIRSTEISSPNQHKSPSQNMLELLHKVDQSKEQNVASHPSSADYSRFSDIPAGPSQSQFSTSHGFSLQLAPPSQGTTPSTLNGAAQSSARMVDSPSSIHVNSEKGDKTHVWMASVSSDQCLPPSHQSSQMESGNESCSLGNSDADVLAPNLKGNLSATLPSGPYTRSPVQSQHLTGPGGQIINDQSAAMSFNRHAYHDQKLGDSQLQAMTSHPVSNSHDGLVSGRDMNQSGMRGLVHQMPAAFYAVTAGMSRKDNIVPLGSNQWPSQQQLPGAQTYNAPDPIKSPFQSSGASGTSFTQQKKDEEDGLKRVNALTSLGIVGGEESQAAEGRSTMTATGASQAEPSARHVSDPSPSNSAVSQKDTEAFHRSPEPNNSVLNSYSLLHQMQAMKSMGSDPSHRESKRLKGQDPQPVVGQVPEPATGSVNIMVREPSSRQTSVSDVDVKILKFSPHLGNRNTSFQSPHGNIASQDMLSFGRSDPQKFATGTVTNRSEHTGISPQMSPSWFEQYETFKNGQLLPVHNMTRVPLMKNAEQQFIGGKSPSNLVVHNPAQLTTGVTEAGQIASACQIANAYIPSEYVSSLNALVPHVSAPSSASMRLKKRKTATFDLLSWNREIEKNLKGLQNMSLAEVNWAQSSNRLVEKIEDETENCEDLLPMIRPKRRLLLTTQLVQQVFRPPSAAVLSLDASSNYEAIVYSLARSVLGDACSVTCGVDSNSLVESGNILSGKAKTSERIQDQYFTKVVGDFVTRAKELENDLLRLDECASILDFRLDCQDLERFSVINRFARFHGRGQVGGAETSSSSDATAMIQKPCPQRYVSAHPMPRNVPERVQCLSL